MANGTDVTFTLSRGNTGAFYDPITAVQFVHGGALAYGTRMVDNMAAIEEAYRLNTEDPA